MDDLEQAAERWLTARASGRQSAHEDACLEDALWEDRRVERRASASMAAPADAPGVEWLCPMFGV